MLFVNMDEQISPAFRLRVVVITLIRVIFSTGQRMVYPFLSFFARGLGVSLTQISFAMTLRSLAGVFNPAFGPLIDRYGRRVGMLLGSGLFTVAMAAMTAFPSYPMFLATVSISFLGVFIFTAALQAYLGDQISYMHRGRVIALMELNWSASFILGVPLIGLLIARFGWQAPFPALAGLGLTAFIVLARMLPKDRPQAQNGSRFGALGKVFTSPDAIAGLLMGVAFVAANEVINLVFGKWLEDAYQVKIAALAASSVIIGASELIGEGFTAWMVDRLGKKRIIAICLALNGLTAAAMPYLSSTIGGALVCLFIFYFSFETAMVSSLPLLTEILPQGRATMMATNTAAFALGRALGAILSPLAYGNGFWLNALLAVALDIVALVCLTRIKISEQ